MTARTTMTTQGLPAEMLDAIATSFVRARLEAAGLDNFPGSVPTDLDTAYQIQDRAIDLWTDNIGGWKVGRIPTSVEEKFGCDRLAGPIFAKTILRHRSADVPEIRVFSNGTAAVEAEFVAVIAEDAPANKIEWSRDDAEALVGELRIGLEIASSPLLDINSHGPAVVVSDFGNNAGLVVGPVISDWNDRDAESLISATYIDDELVGAGGAFGLTGGIARSVQFILELAAKRGRPLRSGDVIATGQTTGIHDVSTGQLVRVTFGDGNDGDLTCRVVAAK